ncbi:hypothetical protein EDM68_00580 [Candidatus Uhrbacteria bacterium]|nr:MAG: hypothetical protein EDM68_00580 [Candidatus Uhrbacteria bacterium]
MEFGKGLKGRNITLPGSQKKADGEKPAAIELERQVAEAAEENVESEDPELEGPFVAARLTLTDVPGTKEPTAAEASVDEAEDPATAATTAMPKSDPPTAPVETNPTPAPEPEQTETGSFEVAVEESKRDASQAETQDAPAVTEEDLRATGVDPESLSFFRAARTGQAPPFEANRISDPDPVPTPTAAPATPPAATATSSAAGPADYRTPPREPRRPNRRIEVPIVTPEAIERRKKLESLQRWGCALLVLCLFAGIVTGIVVGGMQAVSWATRRGWIGDGAVGTGRETVRPPDRATAEEPETEPPAIPIEEERAPTGPVMPSHARPSPDERGLAASGQPSGTFVRMRMHQAFPRSCASLGSNDLPGDAEVFCGRGERRGDDYCACEVSGHVP